MNGDMGPGAQFAHFVCRNLYDAYLHVRYKIEITGLEQYTGNTGVIIAVNHISEFQSVAMVALLRRRLVRALAKQELWNHKFLGWFLSLVGMIPVRGERSDEGLGVAARWLRSGGAILVFPEGRRTDGQHVYRGRTGIARLIYDLGTIAPVLPGYWEGPIRQAEFSWFKPWTWRQLISIEFGHRRQFTHLANIAASDRTEAMRLIMHDIADLGMQEYADTYAPAR